jgi:hypothetical protein
MENLTFLREVLGNLYVSQQQEDIVFNYSFLLKEKKAILNKINTLLMYEDDNSITLEDWHIELLQLQSDRILFDSNNNVIQYPQYFSQEELTIISILKKATYNPDKLTQEEMQILIKFFKNRKLVEDILASSGNGLKLNKRSLSRVMTLFEGYTPTTNKNITLYESLCTKLSLTKKDTHTLKKVA